MTRSILNPLAAGLALVLSTAPSARATTVSGALDAALATLVLQTGTPGAAATITRDGATLWSGAAGYADLSTGAVFTTGTLSSIASVTKLFTATIITRLAEDGLIDREATLDHFVPGIPGADRVTIRQLVEMTAGYADVENLPEFLAAFEDPNHPWTRAEIFAAIEPPKFEPGSEYDDSNTNYLLLGAVIDAIYPGGTSAAFRDYIAEPAALGDDVVFDRDPPVAARVAHGYATRDGVTVDVNEGAADLGVNTSVWGPLWTDGGIVATAEGVARFADALYGGQILNAANTDAARTCGYTFNGLCFTGFLGAFNGYSAFVLHESIRNLTISAVTNALDEDDARQIAFIPGLIDAYLAATEPPAPSPVPLPATAPLLGLGLAGLVGFCRARRVGRTRGV